jgi:hypothetical protein
LLETATEGIGCGLMKLVRDPAEQTTAVTDIILALIACGGLMILQWSPVKTGGMWRIHIWSAAIGLIGLAAILGAVAHGLVLMPNIHNRIWQALNLALSLAVSLFIVGVINDLWGAEMAKKALPFVLLAGLGFYITTPIYPGIFLLIIVYEGLALALALCAYLFLAVRGAPGAEFMAGGILLSIVAAGLQASKKISFTLIWKFDHNGIYHLVQTLGLFLLIAGLWISSVR